MAQGAGFSTSYQDLREVRTTFLPKAMAYALSYEYRLPFAACFETSERTVVLRHGGFAGADQKLGDVFHVLHDSRVPGLDKCGHEVPHGFRVSAADERVTLCWPPMSGSGRLPAADDPHATSGTIEGRAVFESEERRAWGLPVRIALTYNGVIQPTTPIVKEDVGDRRIRANVYLTTFFEISLAEYHWLSEWSSIGFGTWELDDSHVHADVDVYTVI